jgi:hypothetical protein
MHKLDEASLEIQTLQAENARLVSPDALVPERERLPFAHQLAAQQQLIDKQASDLAAANAQAQDLQVQLQDTTSALEASRQ